ncbi:hypothetical protein G9A89_016089 [Geosiphon pyriformis]|nr:hypothetical protein G9A89_016089 [Geosiphon pyriformis]
MEDQSFDKSIPVEERDIEQISQPSKPTKNRAATAWIIIVDGNTKTPIEEIDNFPFEINGIQIPTKVLIMEATQYQALVGNDWLSKANATLD